MVLPIKGLSRIDLCDVLWLVYSFDFPSAAAELRVPTQELVTFWQRASTIGHNPVSPKPTLTTLSSCCQAAIYTSSVKQQSSGSNATLHRKHTYSVLSLSLSVVCVIYFFYCNVLTCRLSRERGGLPGSPGARAHQLRSVLICWPNNIMEFILR